jgi:ribonuclease Y
MDIYLLIIIFAFVAVLTFVGGWFFSTRLGQSKVMSAEERAKKIIADAERDAAATTREKLLEVKDEWYKKKQEYDNDVNQKRNKLQAY